MKHDPFTSLKRSAPRKRRLGKPRRSPWRSEPYRLWIARHDDVIDMMKYYGIGVRDLRHFLPGRINDKAVTQAAHCENNGQSSKGPDWTCIPLSVEKHLEYDSGRKAFERKYGVLMAEIWPQYYAAWQDEQERLK